MSTQERVSNRRASCNPCPINDEGVCAQHVIITTFGKFWLRLMGASLVASIPVMITFTVYLVDIREKVAVLVSEEVHVTEKIDGVKKALDLHIHSTSGNGSKVR